MKQGIETLPKEVMIASLQDNAPLQSTAFSALITDASHACNPLQDTLESDVIKSTELHEYAPLHSIVLASIDLTFQHE